MSRKQSAAPLEMPQLDSSFVRRLYDEGLTVAAKAVRGRSGRHVGEPFLQLRDDGRVGGVLRFALVLQRGGDGRDPDLAVMAVEIRIVLAAVLRVLGRILLGHLLLR